MWQWFKNLFTPKDKYPAPAPEAPPPPPTPIRPPVPGAIVVKPPSGSGRLLGIDTSHYEPPVNWVAAKDGGVAWMYTKASEGSTHRDQSLKQHLLSARAAGLITGAYHFFHASENGMVQAALYMDCVRGLPIDFHVLDWEQGSVDGKSRDVQIAEALRWLDFVEKATGKIPWIYMGKALAAELKLPPQFARYPAIFANYSTTFEHFMATAPGPWPRPTAWQYTDAETVPGLGEGHHVDANYFLGKIEELKSMLGV